VTLLSSFPAREYLDLTHCDCPLLLRQNRTFPSTVFSTYTMEEIWQLAHGVQQRCCPLYRWQRNTARSRMECTRLSQLFRRYWCAQEHLCFYALTTVFPSISRFKRSHTRVDKQSGNSNDDPIFSNSLSLRQTTHSPGSFSSHNDGSYKDLHTFTASLLVNLGPLSGSSPPW